MVSHFIAGLLTYSSFLLETQTCFNLSAADEINDNTFERFVVVFFGSHVVFLIQLLMW
jgi:hypothetical protein